MPMLNTGGNSKTELTEVKSQLEQINSEKYDKVTLYENELKFYANEVELTSIKLPASEGSGQNAREIELQKSETHIQWRYVGEEVWRDLVALNDIKGDAGAKGDKGDRGLPVSININEINYTHQDGIITLPNYPNKTSDLENDAGFITSADIDTTQNHVHTNKSSLDKITEQKLTSWDSKSDFSGSYNDLTDKPNIPSVVGLATESYVNTKVAGIVDSAPETLNTLNELSIALGNDPNFATTVANQIGTKADKSHNHNTDYASKSSEHNHANKTTLDKINDSKIANWNDAYTHSQIAHDYAHSTHDHNASQITEMTGYAKPPTTSAIAATDSLNVAIGKLEKSLDEKQASGSYAPASHTSDAVTHITADERAKWNAKSNLTLGNTSSTAFRGDQGLIAYDHSQVAHAPANAEQNVQADWNEANTGSDAYIKNKPTIPTVDVNKAYVDAGLDKKADKTSLHTHSNKDVLDAINTSKVAQWDKAVIFEQVQIDDANIWLTTGYTKTKDSTTNLPLQCDTSTDKWGILQFVSENAELGTGSQLFFPIDGKYKGRIFVRSITNRQPGQWILLSTFSGSYNDLTEKPTIPVVDVTKSYVDEKLSGKADTTHIHQEYTDAMHNHVNKATLDTITQASINKWDSSLNLTNIEVYGGNVDTKTTPGYYLTNGDNTGLPPECNDRWNRTGLLYVISANKGDGKCIQTYYPLDGATNGNIYWRAVFPGDIKEWKKASNFSGSYNDLTDKPQIPTPEQIQSWDNKVDKSELNNHKFWSGTQLEYDAIPNKDANTIYFIKKV